MVAAGIDVCSYTAETTAALTALTEVSQRVRTGWTGSVRLVTDSKSLVDALKSPQRSQCRLVQDLSNVLARFTDTCPTHIVWVPGHCGVEQNEIVDKLAKHGISLPIAQQLEVPLDFSEVKHRLRTRQQAKPIIEELSEELANKYTLRLVQVALSQLGVGHVRSLHPVATYMDDKPAYCPLCSPQVLNTVEHYILRCRYRARTRRQELPPLSERQGLSVEEVVRKWPEEVLAYVDKEGFFDK